MDRSIALKAGLVQIALVAVISGVLAVTLPKSFFEEWGWLSGPGAWMACAALTATVLRLPVAGAMIGAGLAGLPSVVAVVLGLHWLGALIAVVLFALWCGRLALDRRLEATVL